jgi:LmbE family N-acetylglucosaminyl deacetylase
MHIQEMTAVMNQWSVRAEFSSPLADIRRTHDVTARCFGSANILETPSLHHGMWGIQEGLGRRQTELVKLNFLTFSYKHLTFNLQSTHLQHIASISNHVEQSRIHHRGQGQPIAG